MSKPIVVFALLCSVAVAHAQPEERPDPQPPEPEPAPVVEPAPVPAGPDSRPAPEPSSVAGPAATIEYDKGFTFRSSDDRFELKAGLRTQTRIEISRPDGDGEEWESRFLLPRLRLQLEGFAFGPATTYKVEFDMANRGTQAVIKDFWVNRVLAGSVQVRAGQWKKPFSRHEITSDFAGEFLERTIANAFGGAGRDIGAAVHNGYEKSPDGLEWAVGLFNGTGDRLRSTLTCTDPSDASTCTPSVPTVTPADFDPEWVARVGWNHGGIKGYSEGDVEGGGPRVAVGASYRGNLRKFVKDAEGDLVVVHAGEVDAIFKMQGFSVAGAVYLVKEGNADAQLGFFAQAGYMVLPKALELAARFAHIADVEMDDESMHEVLGAISWYFSESHNYKWMIDGGVLHSTAAETSDAIIRSQIQLVF
jgi:hypothetical protein